MTAPGTNARRAAWPVYPVLIAISMVLAAWVESEVSILSVPRALAIVVVTTGAMIFVLGRLIGIHRSALAVASLLLAFRAAGLGHALLGLLLVLLVVAAIALWLRTQRRSLPVTAEWVTGPANLVSAALFAVVIASSIINGQFSRALSDLGFAASRVVGAGSPNAAEPGPSVYLILLDGYPRADTLERVFGFDNQPLIDDLESRGFDVATNGRSNYMWTTLSLATIFDMRHLSPSDSTTPLEMVNDGSVVNAFRERGYRVAASATPWEGAALRRADVTCGDGINEFERHLIRLSVLTPAINWIDPNFLANRQRGYVDTAFECIAQHAGTQQQLYFGHVASPHLPIVFEADGSPAPLQLYSDVRTSRDASVPIDEFRAAYLEQIRYVNSKTLVAVDSIIAADPEAVVIVISDHGSEFGLHYTDPARSDLDERFGILFAARTPGAPNLYDNDVTLVNLFPVLLREYFALNVPDQPDHQYLSPADQPTRIERAP